jgi:hypothetical protein
MTIMNCTLIIYLPCYSFFMNGSLSYHLVSLAASAFNIKCLQFRMPLTASDESVHPSSVNRIYENLSSVSAHLFTSAWAQAL